MLVARRLQYEIVGWRCNFALSNSAEAITTQSGTSAAAQDRVPRAGRSARAVARRAADRGGGDSSHPRSAAEKHAGAVNTNASSIYPLFPRTSARRASQPRARRAVRKTASRLLGPAGPPERPGADGLGFHGPLGTRGAVSRCRARATSSLVVPRRASASSAGVLGETRREARHRALGLARAVVVHARERG